ncbi:hypothetical protein [Halalkalibacterium ligniniphilum]|uniref:hypothetical protein n=1 Tax=Halalkalibacterium ligniniphilum TaxID=1134413 RepID=UPI000348CC32|nr:hypothetical protein [Halalkalibacterium ligniniphilum]
MSKLQLYQLFALLLLGVFVLYSYYSGTRYDLLFFLIVAVNLVLWLFRLRERRQQAAQRDD